MTWCVSVYMYNMDIYACVCLGGRVEKVYVLYCMSKVL